MCIFACCITRYDAYGVWIYLFNMYNLSNWVTAYHTATILLLTGTGTGIKRQYIASATALSEI